MYIESTSNRDVTEYLFIFLGISENQIAFINRKTDYHLKSTRRCFPAITVSLFREIILRQRTMLRLMKQIRKYTKLGNKGVDLFENLNCFFKEQERKRK